MRIPEISHLQYAVLRTLLFEERGAGDLIEVMTEARGEKTSVSSYQFLKRLETDGYVVGELKKIGPGPARRFYRIADKGRQAYSQVLDFYAPAFYGPS